jgi:hypothetical protein
MTCPVPGKGSESLPNSRLAVTRPVANGRVGNSVLEAKLRLAFFTGLFRSGNPHGKLRFEK